MAKKRLARLESGGRESCIGQKLEINRSHTHAYPPCPFGSALHCMKVFDDTIQAPSKARSGCASFRTLAGNVQGRAAQSSGRCFALHPCDRLEPAAIAFFPFGLAHFRLEHMRRTPDLSELLATPKKANCLAGVIRGAKRRGLRVPRHFDSLAENIGDPLQEPRIGRHAAI